MDPWSRKKLRQRSGPIGEQQQHQQQWPMPCPHHQHNYRRQNKRDVLCLERSRLVL